MAESKTASWPMSWWTSRPQTGPVTTSGGAAAIRLMRTFLAGLCLTCMVAVPLLGAEQSATASMAGVRTDDRPQSSTARMDAFVRDQMDAHDVPAVAYAVVGPEGTLHSRTFGTDGNGDPVTSSTPFLWGSVAKSITATLVMELVEAGFLQLDEPVKAHLPDVEPDITVRHLLAHTSGLPTSFEYTDRFDEGRRPTTVLPRVTPKDLVSTPGSEFHYSSTNYLILAALVEEVTGHSFTSELRTRVLEPTGMTDSITTPDQAAERLPRGHRYVFGQPTAFASPIDPAGTAYGYLGGSLEDAARFASASIGSGMVDREQREAMFRREVGTGPEMSYGLGWRRWPVPGTHHEMVWHGGAVAGYQAAIVVLPDRERAIVVLKNAYSPFRDRQYLDTAFGLAAMVHGESPTTSDVGLAYPTTLVVLAGIVVLLLALVARTSRQLLRGATGTRGRRASAVSMAAWVIGLSALLYGAGVAMPAALGVRLTHMDLWAPDVAWLVYGVLVAAGLLLVLRVALGLRVSPSDQSAASAASTSSRVMPSR